MRIKNFGSERSLLELEALDVLSALVKDRIIFLCEEIDAVVAKDVCAKIIWLNKKDPKTEITLYINSGGGSVPDGLLSIYDTMQLSEAPIKTVCIGEAYSSAAIILASGTKGFRFAYPNARIMIHNVSIDELSGTVEQVQEETKQLKDLNKILIKLISDHTGQSERKVKYDCRKDKYFTPEQAVSYGLIDGILTNKKSTNL